jgi:hypothetical protein
MVLPLSSFSVSPGGPSARPACRGSCRGRRCATAGRTRTSRSWRCRPAPSRCAGRSAPGVHHPGGVLAFVSTPRTMRPEKRPHRSGACTSTGSRWSCVGATGAMGGVFSGAPVSARPRARCRRRSAVRQVGRELEREERVVELAGGARMSAPTGASAASSSRPPWSSASFSSRAEHSMPRLSTPRSLPTPILKGLPSARPAAVRRRRWPAARGCRRAHWARRRRSAAGRRRRGRRHHLAHAQAVGLRVRLGARGSRPRRRR